MEFDNEISVKHEKIRAKWHKHKKLNYAWD